MNIVHITPGIGPTSFGVGQVALNLAREQNALGNEARIWCVSSAEDVEWASSSSGLAKSRISRFPLVGPARLAYSPAMVRAATGREASEIDIVHQHGIWTGCSYVTNRLHRRYRVPHVVAPHGSLQEWALRRSRLKKSLALGIYERSNLGRAACLHATARSEIDDFRNYGLTAPVALIPNGVSDRWLNSLGNADLFRAAYDIPADCRILFFLSRITPKKGLPMFIEALHALQAEMSNWLLVIAGTDEFGHKAEIDALVDRMSMRKMVRIIGPLFDQAKRDAFAAADLFVLPSYSEGAPVVVLDSLAVGVPVLTTKGAPWQDLSTHRCGWWTDISVEGLMEALRAAARLPREELATMGRRGRDLVATQYSWVGLAQKTLDLYTWLLGHGDRPDFVTVS